jgi:hypothetical protein
VAGSDYSNVSATLTLPAGATSRTVTVWVHGDRTREANEYLWVKLDMPTHATLGRDTAKGTIANDD